MPSAEVIFKSNNSPTDTVSKFSQTIEIPKSNTKTPVTVQVLEVKTSKAIKLLPAFEKQVVIQLESSTKATFLREDTDYAFVTVDTTNFNMAQSYDSMFSDCLRPIDFHNTAEWESLGDPVTGFTWFNMLYNNVMNKSKYFETAELLEGFRWTIDRFVKDAGLRTNWYKEVRNQIGPLFMLSKKPDTTNSTQNFLKWLWLENYKLLTDLDLVLNSNHPINNQMKVRNDTDRHVRFLVPDIRTDHSLFSLFSTLPPIRPFSTSVSQGGQFLPKEPFLSLEVHSNLCRRRSATGREKEDLLASVFMGDTTQGFTKQEHIQNLPLALPPGYQTIFFHINATAYGGELLYIHPETASTTIKLRFVW